VLIGLSPFVACEAVLRAFDWQRPDLHDDPFVGFSRLNPLFVLNPERTRYEIPPAHYKFFAPESFDAVKPPGEFRVFCLGASTTQGRPFSRETSYTTWLELSLRAADPSHPWRVINCGGVSYASYRLVEVLREVLAYKPDLLIVDMGHNEFLEDRTYSHIKSVPRLLRRPLELAARLRTLSLLRTVAEALARRFRGAEVPAAPPRPMLGPEVEAKLDYRGGLASYHHDDAWRAGVIAHFEFNLRRMVRIAREAHVPLILVNPVYNLETPPFKSEHRPGLSAADARQFDALWAEARRDYRRNMPAAVERLRQAIAIDDQHAGIYYALASCFRQLGRDDAARQAYIEAKEHDVCPLRILEPMCQAILDVGRETKTPVVDLVADFAARSEGGILGNALMVDHVHPSIAGHQVVAEVLLDEMVHEGFLKPVAGWKRERDRLYRKQLDSLDDFYYLMGEKHLENLRLWAQGRGDRVRPARRPGEPR
jgi:lysophospholipase L1-like esterase